MIERIEDDVVRRPVLGRLHTQVVVIQRAIAGEHLHFRCAAELLRLDADRKVILAEWREPELLNNPRVLAFRIPDQRGAVIRAHGVVFPVPLLQIRKVAPFERGRWIGPHRRDTVLDDK